MKIARIELSCEIIKGDIRKKAVNIIETTA